MKYIVYILTLLMATIGFVACSEENSYATISQDDNVTVHLILALGEGASSATRGIPSDPIHEMRDGSIAENWVNDVEILVYNETGEKFIERATITTSPHKLTADELELRGLNKSKEGVYYSIEGTLYNLPYEDLQANKSFSFVVLCNLGDKTGTNALYTTYGYNDENIGDTEYNPLVDAGNPLITGSVNKTIKNLAYRGYSQEFTSDMLTIENNIPSKDARIPLWGFLKTQIQNEGIYTVDVLRAMAKVRVKLDESLKSQYTLKGVTLSHANSAGYHAAQNINETRQAISGNTTNWNYRNTTNGTSVFGITDPSPLVDNTSTVLTDLPFVGVNDAGEPSTNPTAYVIYIPEYRNMGENGQPLDNAATMSLSLINSNEETVLDYNKQPYKLLFAKYTDSYGNAIKPRTTEWDIIRNDFFDYTITSITPNGELNAKVRVNPWKYETMDYELSQNQSVVVMWPSHKPYKYDNYGNHALPVAHENEMEMGFVRIQISMPQPKGVKWMAHLTNERDFKFVYEYTPTNGSNKETYSDYGFGAGVSLGTNPTEAEIAAYWTGLSSNQVTIAIAPVNPYEPNTNKRTELYFTIETLTEGYAQINPNGWVDEIVNTIPDRICIVQTIEENIEKNY